MLYFVKTIFEMKHINVIKDVINLNALQMSIEHNVFSKQITKRRLIPKTITGVKSIQKYFC